MQAYGHLGDITGGPAIINMGDYRGAIVWFGKAAAIAQQMLDADPSNALARSDAGIAYSRLGISQAMAGEHRQALETFERAEPRLLSALAAAPESEIVALSLAFTYRFKAQSLAALDEDRAGIEVLRRSLDLCRAWLAKEPMNLSWNHLRWLEQGLLATTLASAGETDEALSQARSLLNNVWRTKLPNDLAPHAYVARALAANGVVHMILARRTSPETRVPEYRTAADFYRQALDEWRLYPNHLKEPSLGDFRRVESALAEVQRELQKAGK
jgi:tetratricopeptide (TPR) repeat protein